MVPFFGSGTNSSRTWVVNFGQDSSFAGNKSTANSNADGNGRGSFQYAPPSGFLAICSQNLADVDIIDGTDNFPSRYLVNDTSVLLGIPYVYGSIFRFEGQVTVFSPCDGGPCYRCLFPDPPAKGAVPD